MEQMDWRNSVLTSPLMKIMADNLNRSASEMDPKTSPLYQAVIGQLDGDRTAIDIGAGVGRFAISLALAGVQVTAVEPSDEMRKHLPASIENEGLSSSINVIPSLWPVKQDLHDEVSFASFIIQFSNDILSPDIMLYHLKVYLHVLSDILPFPIPLWHIAHSKL